MAPGNATFWVKRTDAAARGVAVVALAIALAACGGSEKPRAAAPPLQRARPPLAHPALAGTIGEIAVFANSTGSVVEGYGIVANLANTGSSDMPPPIRELLKEQLYTRGAGMRATGTEKFSPERLLSSRMVAAVEVRGRIPPLARRGTSFDLYLTALPGTQTTSLERGVLWTAELKDRGIMAPGEMGMADTFVVANGEGPVYCQPDLLPPASPPDKRHLRSARVIGGGVVQADQPIRLQLYAPSAHSTQLIQRAVNSRWNDPHTPFASTEVNSGHTVVTLRVPPEYQNHPREFVDLVLHLYLATEVPGYAPRKAAELLAALKTPGAPCRQLSLALQGLGRSILDDHLRPHYTAADPIVRFYTARAGAMLSDYTAMVVLQEIAKDSGSKFQLDAISALADAAAKVETSAATRTLVELLDSTNLQVRIAAYHGLVNMNSPALRTGVVGRNFILDYVPSKGPALIYATQSGQRRIALIGKPAFLPAGLLYVSRDNSLTVNVPSKFSEDLGDTTPTAPTAVVAPKAATKPSDKPAPRPESVTLYYRSPLTGRTATLKSADSLASVLARLGFTPNPRSKDYDPNAPFIGASYQQLIEMISCLTREQQIQAEFYLEPAPEPILSPTDVLSGGRPERSADTRPAPTTAAQPQTRPR